MTGITRRRATALLLAGPVAAAFAPGSLLAAPRPGTIVRGVEIGVQGWSFRELPLADLIDACRSIGFGECELWLPNLIPVDQRETDEGAAWLRRQPLSHFRTVRRQFDAAGIRLDACTYAFRRDMSVADFTFGFDVARALGVRCLTSSGHVSAVPRVDRLAQQYRLPVGFHGHDSTADPDEFSTEDSYVRALAGTSRYLRINLDIGHLTAAGGDAVGFVSRHHDRIVTLHVKDRRRDHGPNVPFGEGDTPIAAVLRLLRDRHWRIPANIEYEYGKPGMDTLTEVRRCLDYCRRALDT